MRSHDQAAVIRIGIVLGVVLTCWFLIAIVASQTQPQATPTIVFGATPARQVTATVQGGATPAAVPRTPTASTFAPPVAPDQPGAVTLCPAIVPTDPSAPPFATDEVRPSCALHP